MPNSDIDSWALQATQSLQRSQAAQIRDNVNQALPVNPDAEAQLRQSASAVGVPLVTARAIPDQVNQQARMANFQPDVLARQFPTTAQLLENPDLARITHDDIPATTNVEAAVKAPAAVETPQTNPAPGKPFTFGRVANYLTSANGDGLLSDVGSGVMSLMKGLGGSFNKLAEASGIVTAAPAVLIDKVRGDDAASTWWFDHFVQPGVNSESAFNLGKEASFADKGFHATGQLLGTLSQIMLTGGAGEAGAPVVAANDSAAAGVGKLIEHGVKAMTTPALAEAVNTGREVYTATNGDGAAALKAASAAYGTTAAAGVVPISAEGGLLKRLFTGALSGVSTGEASRITMNAALPDNMQQPFDWESAFLSTITGAALGGVMGGRGEPASQMPQIRDTYTEAYQSAKAEAQAEQLTQIAKASTASKLRERDPQAFKQFVANAADGGDMQSVHIEGQAFAQMLEKAGITGDEIRQTMPDVASQLDAALGQNAPKNGLVTIPIEDFATHIAGSKIQDAFLQAARVSPDSATVGESEAFKQSQQDDMQQRAQQIADAHVDDTGYQASVDKMNAQVDTNLAALKMRPDQLDANAALLKAFYTTQAERTGMLPHEFAEKYPVKASNKALAGGKLGQSSGDAPFDLSYVVDGNKLRDYKIDGATVTLDARTDQVRVSSIRVPQGQRGQGFARSAMEKLIAQADREGVSLSLDASAMDKKTSQGKLEAFYISLGFKPTGKKINALGHPEMVREPHDGQKYKQDVEHIEDDHLGPAAALIEAGKSEKLFQYPKSAEKDPIKIAADKGSALKVTEQSVTQMDGTEKPTGSWEIQTPNHGYATMTRENGKVWINVAGLAPGDAGSRVYDLAANYAHNNGLKFVGDPAGVSKAAMIRRAENMLSSAVKYGTTDHLEPHPAQIRGNKTVPGIDWHEGDTLHNVRALMDATMGANAKLAPLAAGIHYDAANGHFTDSDGARFEGADVFGTLSNEGRGEAGAGAPGEATLRRDALFRSLLQGEGARRAFLDDVHRVEGDGSPGAGEGVAGSFYQDKVAQPARGEFSPSAKTIALLKDANLSTFQHELGHFFLDTLSHMAAQAGAPAQVKADMATFLKWQKIGTLDDWHEMSIDEQREHHEAFATGWETYLMRGQAPSLELRGLFSRMRAWMISVYKSLKNAPGDFTPEVRGVFDRMIASEDAIHQAEMARKYMPLFDSPEASGMTPEEWAAYQAKGKDATEQAIESLIGKTMKDMAKTDRLRTASLRAVQRDAAEKRKALTTEVRSEVMSSPVYRAWSFLTGKDSAQLPDEINAEHLQAVRDWSEKREEHLADVKADVKAKAWEASDVAKQDHKNYGLAKGQWLAKNRARVDLEVHRQMLDYDAEHKKPSAPVVPDTASKDPTTGAGKIDLEALREAVGKDAAKPLQNLRMTTATGKGMKPGEVADMFGFPDIETLVKAITETEPPRAAVEGIVDQRMLERHGEISSPEAMAKTADELVQNEVRSTFVATELRALKKSIGKPKEIVEAAKEAAQNTIDVKRVRDINEGQFRAAETRSATQAEKAMMKGNIEGAAAAKRDQLLNMELGRAARDAKDFVAKSLEYLKKFDKASVREAIDVDYRDQIDALLDRADLRKGVSGTALDKRATLQSWVEKMAAQGYKPDIPESLLNEAERWHYKDMPFAAFRGLVDSVKLIEQLGKLKEQLRDGQETRRIGDLADEMRDTAAKLPQLAPDSNRGLTRMESKWVTAKAFGRSARASLLKMEQMFDWLDGRSSTGVMNRVVFKRMSEAGIHENELLRATKQSIDELMKANLDDIAKTKQIFTADDLIDGTTGRPQKFTTKEMLMLAGNAGNESNLGKLAKGEGWEQQAVWDFLNKNMTAAHWDFVEGMGKTLETLWPEKVAMGRRLGETTPEKIQPRPFQTPDGKTRSGWYWPLMYDPARSQDVAERGARTGDALFENIYSKPNSDTGRMNTRNENYARPILLDLDALPRMIKDEIHDVAWREAVIDADRFTAHPTVRKAIIDALGQEHYDQIRPWLISLANDGKLSAEGNRGWVWLNKVASEARTRATIVGLGYRLTTAAVHGLSAGMESVAELGPVWFGRGLKDFSNPAQWAANKAAIFEKSGEMRNRADEVDRDIREHLRAIDTALMDPASSALSRGTNLFRSHAYDLIAGLDMATALPTWQGAYLKGMTPVAEGGMGLGEQDAVYYADKTVRNAHGGTGVKDMAAIQRGSEFQKLFTMFYTFWNHNVNRLMDTAKLIGSAEHRAAMKEANHWSDSQLAATIILRTLVYTIGVQTMHAIFHPPKDDDTEGWFKYAAKEMGSVAFGGVPIARDIYAHYATGRDYSATPAAGIIDTIGKSGTDLAAALTGKQVDDKWVKHIVATGGVVFNLPTGQPANVAQTLWDMGNGTADPTSIKDWYNGLLHGDVKHH